MARFAYRELVAQTTPASNWSKFVAHPVADAILWLLANFTTLHPNVVTLIANVLGGGAALAFLRGDRTGFAVGAILFYFAFALDAIDGALARLTGKTSALGAWLDTIADFLRSQLCTACLAIGTYRATGDIRAFYLGFALAAVIGFYYYLAEVSQKLTGQRPAHLAKESKHPLHLKLKRWGIVPSPFGLPDLEGVCFVLFPLLNLPLLGMVIAASIGAASRLLVSLVVLRTLQTRANRS
jgi:phosphatidylglycerophosphate synthase